MYIPQGLGVGITKLSELEIDADKDWQAKGIFNIKELASGMGIGDILQHNGSILAKFSPGTANYVLTSEGPGKIVVWAPGGTYFYRYFPVSIDISHAEGVVIPKEIGKTIIVASALSYPTPTKTPEMTLGKVVTVVTPKESAKTISPATQAINYLNHLLGGAVADDGGSQTDETTAANNDTPNDMTLLPAIPAINDAYYFGDNVTFPRLRLIISTAGAGIWNGIWEYWNGTIWTGLSGVSDPTNAFRIAGDHQITWTEPGDWALTTILAMNLYWVRFRITDYTSVTTQPLGQRSWTMTAA